MAMTAIQAATDQAIANAHLVPLPGSDWSLWRSVCVRGAGFPAEMLRPLAAPAAAHAADGWIRAERRVSELKAECKRLRRAARAGGDPAMAARAESVVATRLEAAADSVAARATFEAAFASETARTSAYFREMARAPRFREAVLWQNRQAVHTALEPLLRAPASRSPADRAEKERLVASYLQRYCAKNDTIGFFGPVGWARIGDHGPALTMAPGPRLLERRAVHFEGWAIDALARALAARPGLRPWLPPRLLPQVRVERTELFIPGRAPVTISATHARLLRACDGQRSARRLARELAGDPAAAMDVYGLLDAFEQMGLVIWSLEVPLERHPERALRTRLEEIGDEAVRRPCLAALATLESCRRDVASAAGDVEALDGALARLESTFTELAGTSATRSPGKTYAGRTLVYEECRRDASIEVGPALLERLGPPLGLILESARWCTWEIARWYRAELGAIVSRQIAKSGTAPLDLATVLAEGFDLGRPGEIPAPIAHVQAELRRRWLSILPHAPEARHVSYRSLDLRERVRDAFPAPAPGWSWARHVSPDLMIAADGAGAIARGDYVIVLGELHLLNTLMQAVLGPEHPDPREVVRALDADSGGPSVVPVHSRDVFTYRTGIGLWPSRTFWYESSREVAPGPRAGVLRTSDLVIEADGGGLWVRARDGRARFEAIEFLSYFLALKSATVFGLFPDAAHTPRVSIDGVVVSRERWQAPAATLAWAWEPTPLARFAGARRWAAAQAVPRCVFVKAPVERKPCYVDFDSPIFVETLAKTVRQSGTHAAAPAAIAITEMLPALDQLWLADAEGRCYTSELRLVAVDPRVPGESDRAAAGETA